MTYKFLPIHKLTLTYPRKEEYDLPLYYDVHYMGTCDRGRMLLLGFVDVT
jgi:hypothetical protein